MHKRTRTQHMRKCTCFAHQHQCCAFVPLAHVHKCCGSAQKCTCFTGAHPCWASVRASHACTTGLQVRELGTLATECVDHSCPQKMGKWKCMCFVSAHPCCTSVRAYKELFFGYQVPGTPVQQQISITSTGYLVPGDWYSGTLVQNI
jgi:hypothetical protein